MYTLVCHLEVLRVKRTQIYLLEKQKEELDKLSSINGKAMAEMIREAVDIYIIDSKLN